MSSNQATSPDVLILMTDQLNPYCLGCAGDPTLRTPNIDQLASEGTRFDACYTVCPVCMPARGSFISGLYPHNHGFWMNYTDRVFPAEYSSLLRDCRAAGYHTAKIGKFHFFNPGWGQDFREYEEYYQALGLDYAEEITGPYMTPFHKGVYTDYLQQIGKLDAYCDDIADRLATSQYCLKPSPLDPFEHNDAFVGRRAVEYIQNSSVDKPLCLFVSFPGPHPPLDAPGPYRSMYKPADVALPENVPEMTKLAGTQLGRNDIRRMRANYYGKITLIDHWIGKIVEALKARGRWTNTLSFFTSDHGEKLGAHGRLSKGSFYEESVRVPLIVRWPGTVPAGRHSSAIVELIDVLPTVLEAIGARKTGGHFGLSFLPLALGETDSIHEAVFSEIAGADRFRIMVRTGKYKWWDQGGRECLYDLEEDPQEMRDLAKEAQYRNLCKEMRSRYAEFLCQTQYNRARDYQPLFTRAGIAAENSAPSISLKKLFRSFHS